MFWDTLCVCKCVFVGTVLGEDGERMQTKGKDDLHCKRMLESHIVPTNLHDVYMFCFFKYFVSQLNTRKKLSGS